MDNVCTAPELVEGQRSPLLEAERDNSLAEVGARGRCSHADEGEPLGPQALKWPAAQAFIVHAFGFV